MTQQVAKAPKPPKISDDFIKYVNYIETSQPIPVYVSFVSLEDLKNSAKYFIDRAAMHPKLIKMFAEGVKRIYFVTPVNGEKEMNFRKAIVYEIQTQLNVLYQNFNDNIWSMDRAVNTAKFFGEIYNLGYIFHWILKKYLDFFKVNIEESLVSYRCFSALVECVKNDVPRLTESDVSVPVKLLKDLMKDVEKNPPKQPNISEDKKATKNIPDNIPDPKSSQLKVIIPPSTFKSIINKLNKENSKEILNQLNSCKCETETWKNCYESLIERALSAPELAEIIISICKKIPSNNNPWQKIKTEDYKKLINQLIVEKFEKLFDDIGCGATHVQVFRILSFIQKLMESSMISIGCVATFIDVLITCAEKNKNLSAQIVFKLMKIFKSGISAEKIRKLPVEKRKKIMGVMSKGGLSRKFRSEFVDIAEFLKVELEDEEIDDETEEAEESDGSLDDLFEGDLVDEDSSELKKGVIGSSISPLLSTPTAEKTYSIEHSNILTTSHEYSNRSSTSREYLNSPTTSGWNGFSQNFPSFVETLNIQQRSYPETFERLINNFTIENSDETLRKMDENMTLPRDEIIFKALLDKVISKPELVDSVVEIFKKVLRHKNSSSNNLNCSNTSSTVIKIIIVSKLEVLLKSAGKEPANTQLWSIIKLIQKLYQCAVISKHCVHYIIDLIKINEKGNNYVEYYATMLEEIVENKKYRKNIELNRSDPNNNEMTSSGEWSDFDSETSRHGILRSNFSSPRTSPLGKNNTFNDFAASFEKTNEISSTFRSLNLDDLQGCVAKITALKIDKQIELQHFVDLIIKDIQNAKSLIPKYSKLAYVLANLLAFGSDGSTTLKAQLSITCQTSLMNAIKAKFTDSRTEDIYCLVELFAELYNQKIVEQPSVEMVLNTLFARETSCFYSVHCIDIIMRKIGPKNDKNDKEMLDKYFKFFQYAIDNTAISYRTTVYKALIEFKNSGWLVSNEVPKQLFFNDVKPMSMAPLESMPMSQLETMPMPQLEPIQTKELENREAEKTQNSLQVLKRLEILHSPVETPPILQDEPPIALTKNPESSTIINLNDPKSAAEKLKNLLSTTQKSEIFVTSLIEQVSSNKTKTSMYALLFKELISISDDFGMTFKEILNENVFKKFATFVSKQNLDDLAMNSFGNVLMMVAELYKHNIFSDEDLSIWLQNKHTKRISIGHLTEISSIISMRIFVNGDDNMIKLLKTLEEIIFNETLKDFSFINKDIKELKSLLESKNLMTTSFNF